LARLNEQEPFVNEFCLVHDVTEDESLAALRAESSTDHDWRVAAGQTTA
jgi:hypothetical protein